jgi:hypothetical protein
MCCAATQERDAATFGLSKGQPMFCFETGVKLFYWSCFVYDYQEVRARHCCSPQARAISVQQYITRSGQHAGQVWLVSVWSAAFQARTATST